MSLGQLDIHYRKIDELLPAEYNPRQISEKMKQELVNSINEFGLVDAIVVNMKEGRENIIVGGHQRVMVIKDAFPEITEVPCVYVYLDLDREKELNLRLNKNTGDWDLEKLLQNFELDLLSNVGFEDYELELEDKNEDELQKAAKKFTNDNVPYPLVPKYTERYDAVIIFSTNELDWTWLRTLLELDKKKDYKNERVGTSQVIEAKQFQEIIDKKIQELRSTSDTAEDTDKGAGEITYITDDDE